ncbi:MAG: hypothetical protein ACLFPF_05645 [Halanaerobiales bacterium]
MKKPVHNENCESEFGNFIQRKDGKLFDGDKELRFVSINCPNLHICEDAPWWYEGDWQWHKIDQFEQEDALKTIKQMGGQVVRMYVFSVIGGNKNIDEMSHILGPSEINEDMFKALDRLLYLCNRYQIRLIIPFIDNWNHWGGVTEFAALRKKKRDDFFTDEDLIKDFKYLINYVLNRTNHITGTKYKDDKAILAWETGNELIYPDIDGWTAEIAAYIKSIDSNHLVSDGHYGVREKSLDDPNVDIVSDHYYNDRGEDFVQRFYTGYQKAHGKKVFYVGEFGSADLVKNHRLINEVIKSDAAGIMYWALRYHCKDGGFYNNGHRWPGFSCRSDIKEKETMRLLREHAYEIQGEDIPPVPVPAAPELLAIGDPEKITWRGSVGAESYDVERSETEDGPWKIVGTEFSDGIIPYQPFSDCTVEDGKKYYYRIIAKNSSGNSPCSNIETFVN